VIVTSDQAILHENYNGIVINNDIAIIRLPEPVSGPSILKLCKLLTKNIHWIFNFMQTLRPFGCPRGPWLRRLSPTKRAGPAVGANPPTLSSITMSWWIGYIIPLLCNLRRLSVKPVA
jgi:hypothetical protein